MAGAYRKCSGQGHSSARIYLLLIAVFLTVIHLARASCDLQITSAGPCLLDGTFGTPNVGDLNGIKVVFNVVGTPTQPFRIKFTMANRTFYDDNITLSPGNGWGWYFNFWMPLDDSIPWAVTLDPDGVSGNTNLLNNTASGTFTPVPPSTLVDLYSSQMMNGSQTSVLNFQSGSGTIPSLFIVFGYPTTHGAQAVSIVNMPSNAQQVVTSPYAAPVVGLMRTNVAAANFVDTTSYTVKLSRIRVNPTLLRAVTWAEMSTMATNWTQWLAPDPVCESTNSQITTFVNQSLPANYQTILTPYDAARALHKAVMKALTYSLTPPHADAVGVLQDGLAECSGFSALLTACLRNIGIPSRPISGNWEGISQTHVRVEFHLPGTEWLVADPTEGNTLDPTGTYAYYFGYVLDADTFLATDVGDNHVTPSNYFSPFNNFYFHFIGTGPNWWWTGGATFNSDVSTSYLEPISTLCSLSCTGGLYELCLTNVPSTGTVVIESSTNLVNWSPVVTNSASGNPIYYSLPVTGQSRKFFRANLTP